MVQYSYNKRDEEEYYFRQDLMKLQKTIIISEEQSPLQNYFAEHC